MKLTKEDIQFIDNYLENSDVVFADIRMEIVDHVASDIEKQMEAGDKRSFYDVFKGYMVQNKAQLLKNNKQFLKSADKKIWQTFLKELKKPITPLVFMVVTIGLYFLLQISSIETFKLFISFMPIVGLTGFILTYIVYQNVKNLKRFSVVERLAFPFIAFYQLPNIFMIRTMNLNETNSFFWTIIIASLALTLMTILIIISIKLFKNYEKRYKSA